MIDWPSPLVSGILSDIEATSRSMIRAAEEAADEGEAAAVAMAWTLLERLRNQLTRLETALSERPL